MGDVEDATEELSGEMEGILSAEDVDLNDETSGDSVSSESSLSSMSTSSLNGEMKLLEEELEDIMIQTLMHLAEIRYMESRTPGIPKDLTFADEVVPNLRADRFQQFFRISRGSFLYIHEAIKNNPIFHNQS